MELDPIVWYLVFVISVTAHEAAHAAAAYLGGDDTAYQGGQVSLNPLPHMQREPFGMVLAPVVTSFTQGFPLGWASAPYDPFWEQRHPRRAAWMAAAGPGANLLLAALAFTALKLGLAAGAFDLAFPNGASRLVASADPFMDNAGRFLAMMLFLNTLLALFNLLPVMPLDGLSLLRLILPADLAQRIRSSLSQPGPAVVGLIAAWMLFPRLFRPVYRTLIDWL
jgi:Zn-dependent protease